MFKWWAWAWTSFALYLGVGSLAVPLSPEWTLPKITVVVLGAVFGFLPPPLLVFGARSMLSTHLPTRREQRMGLALVMALALPRHGKSPPGSLGKTLPLTPRPRRAEQVPSV